MQIKKFQIFGDQMTFMIHLNRNILCFLCMEHTEN